MPPESRSPFPTACWALPRLSGFSGSEAHPVISPTDRHTNPTATNLSAACLGHVHLPVAVESTPAGTAVQQFVRRALHLTSRVVISSGAKRPVLRQDPSQHDARTLLAPSKQSTGSGLLASISSVETWSAACSDELCRSTRAAGPPFTPMGEHNCSAFPRRRPSEEARCILAQALVVIPAVPSAADRTPSLSHTDPPAPQSSK